MAAFIPVLLGAAAAGAAYLGYKKITEPKALVPGEHPFVTPGDPLSGAATLEKGRVYAVTVVFDVTKVPGMPSPPPQTTQENWQPFLKAMFEGSPNSPEMMALQNEKGLGFKVLSQPMFRDEAEGKKFFAGQPSAWVFTAQRTGDTIPRGLKFDMSPAMMAILPSANFYLLPTV